MTGAGCKREKTPGDGGNGVFYAPSQGGGQMAEKRKKGGTHSRWTTVSGTLLRTEWTP